MKAILIAIMIIFTETLHLEIAALAAQVVSKKLILVCDNVENGERKRQRGDLV